MGFGAAVVDGRGARRGRRGHPWIFHDTVIALDAEPGDVVRVVDRSGQFVCWAAASPASRIRLRRISRETETPDEAFWQQRFDTAVARRGALPSRGCARLLHADADRFPGLTLDWYAGHLVLQATTVWADRFGVQLVRSAAKRLGATSVLARNDVSARRLEGLGQEVVVVDGEPPRELIAEIGGVERIVDLRAGHKTGAYLDQQENQRMVSSWLSGGILDLFCGEGGFALPLARDGSIVMAVDQSAAGIERGRRSAERAGIDGRIEWVCGNAFDVLAGAHGAERRFDAVLLDPPPLARGPRSAAAGAKAYADLHRRAFRLLRPGGRILSFCCSHSIDAKGLLEAARIGAEQASVSARVLARLGPAADHPERIELPESRYLKGLLIQVDDASPAAPA